MASLAPFAFAETDSRGRRFPEPPHPYRGEYQRDRDRIVHARAFRRLEDKTQVFTERYSDHFRNRLTHTLEVSQISRTVAQALQLNGDLVETLALAHDIGHPPFGHAGERVLNQCMAPYGERFDHNLQALRIVEEFEIRYAAFHGLNLTFEVREGIVKHSRDYTAAEAPGLAEYVLDQRPPLEAQLIDFTDEISYSCADLDDGFEAHLLTLDQIADGVPAFAELLADVERRFGRIGSKLRFNEALKGLLNRLVTDLIDATRARVSGLASVAEVRAAGERLAGFSPKGATLRRTLKEFLWNNLYQHPQLASEHERAARLVMEMFHFYMSEPTALPRSYQVKLEQEPRHRVVCDYLAGMTDSYIARLHDACLRIPH